VELSVGEELLRRRSVELEVARRHELDVDGPIRIQDEVLAVLRLPGSQQDLAQLPAISVRDALEDRRSGLQVLEAKRASVDLRLSRSVGVAVPDPPDFRLDGIAGSIADLADDGDRARRECGRRARGDRGLLRNGGGRRTARVRGGGTATREGESSFATSVVGELSLGDAFSVGGESATRASGVRSISIASATSTRIGIARTRAIQTRKGTRSRARFTAPPIFAPSPPAVTARPERAADRPRR
jgi:hypothetical protein